MKVLQNTDGIVAVGLLVVLITSIFYGSNELSMSIASGLIGYIGRGKESTKERNNEGK